jgi:hypothetical protein
MTRRCVLILLALAALIALARLRFVHDLPDWDVATYSLIGREMLHGKKLYLDIWDMKPPAIFASYAAANAAFGSWEWSAYALGVLTAWVTLLGVYFAAATLDRRAGWWAGALWASVCMTPALGAIFPNTEAFINALLAVALALVLAGSRTRLMLLAGVAVGAGQLLQACRDCTGSGAGRGVRDRVRPRFASKGDHPIGPYARGHPVGVDIPDRILRRHGTRAIILRYDLHLSRFYAASASVERGAILPRYANEILPLLMLAILIGVPAMWRRGGCGSCGLRARSAPWPRWRCPADSLTTITNCCWSRR